MAQRVNVELVDDLDGSAATETVQFGLDGKGWEIDLNEKNAAKLRKALEPFVEKARRVGAPTRSRRSSGSGVDVQAVKAWAKSVGKDYPQRGRLPQALVDEYKAAGF